MKPLFQHHSPYASVDAHGLPSGQGKQDAKVKLWTQPSLDGFTVKSKLKTRCVEALAGL